MASNAYITSVGAYAEEAPDQQVWVTISGAYAEFRNISYAHITSVGAYIEMVPPPPPYVPRSTRSADAGGGHTVLKSKKSPWAHENGKLNSPGWLGGTTHVGSTKL